jgi:hypothetical protein
MKCSESFGVPDTTIPASPADWSLTRSNHVEPLPLEKIFRIRAGVDRLDRHHEPHPVDRGDHPATPRLRQFDPGLGLDQWGVGQRVGLHPQVVLVDVGDPVAGELPGRGDRAIADVQRVRGERRGENHLQVAHAGLAAGDRVERLDHLRVPRHDFQDQFADVDRREHLRDPAAQVDQARWFVQRVQGRDVQPVRVVDGDRGVRVEPGGDVAVHRVQLGLVPRQQHRGVLGQPQRGQHGRFRRRPLLACEQAGTWSRHRLDAGA